MAENNELMNSLDTDQLWIPAHDDLCNAAQDGNDERIMSTAAAGYAQTERVQITVLLPNGLVCGDEENRLEDRPANQLTCLKRHKSGHLMFFMVANIGRSSFRYKSHTDEVKN